MMTDCEQATGLVFKEATEFVALQLMSDWSRQGDFSLSSPIISADVQSLGISIERLV